MLSSRFASKSVLITGATSGIGFAAASRLAQEGARLFLLGRSEDRLIQALAQFRGTEHRYKVCDLTREDEVEAAIKSLVEEAQTRFFAGIFSAGAHSLRPFAMTKAVHLKEMMSANFDSAMISSRCFFKYADVTGASCVFISSVAALQGGASVTAYSAAKGALVSAARCLAVEFAPKKIRVNVILPGVVTTPMSEKFFSQLSKEQSEAIVSAHPLGVGKPEDVASSIAFLASEEARWITGAEFVIDGGLTCK